MAQIIDLDDLVPDDLEFRFRGETYVVAGDLSIETVLGLIKNLGRWTEAKNDKESQDALLGLERDLLVLFKERQPDLEKLPFGLQGVTQVTLALLRQIGAIDADSAAPDMDGEEGEEGNAKGGSSRRSSGSTRSSSKPGSRRPGGA